MAPFRHNFRVRYAETDRMGVSYYAHYFVWFEMGRAEYLRALGLDYNAYEARGIFLPVVEAHARYLESTTYDDLLTLEVTVSKFGRSSMRFDYRILNAGTGTRVAEGYTVHVFLNREKRPLRVPDEIRQQIPVAALED